MLTTAIEESGFKSFGIVGVGEFRLGGDYEENSIYFSFGFIS